jgi:hypothetical protein
MKPGELTDIIRELALLRVTDGRDNRTSAFLSEARATTVRSGDLCTLQEALWCAALRWQGITTWRPDAGTPLLSDRPSAVR